MPQFARPFDLVVVDLDGTILDKRFENGFSANVVDTIARVQAAGVPVTIATGRVFGYVRGAAQRLAIQLPVVTTQGALVAHPLSGEVIFEALLPQDLALSVAQWVDESGPVTALYVSDGNGDVHLYQNREEDDPDFYDHWLGTPRRLHARFHDLLSNGHAHSAFKFIFFNPRSAEEEFSALLSTTFGPALHVTRTHDLLVEGTAAGIDKGEGLRQLLAHLQIDPSRVLAIGDNDNDIPMLQLAGFGVAMGQSTAAVKSVADWVAPPIEEDGAAVAMQKFVLEPMGITMSPE